MLLFSAPQLIIFGDSSYIMSKIILIALSEIDNDILKVGVVENLKKATQYVNAKAVGEVEYKGGKLTKFDFANIGRQGSESWDGLLDEVIIFNKAVSTDELKTVMKGIEQNVLSVEANDKLAITWAEVKQ